MKSWIRAAGTGQKRTHTVTVPRTHRASGGRHGGVTLATDSATEARGSGRGTPRDLLRVYLSDIGRHALLTAADERRLARRIEAGRAAARALADGEGDRSDEERARLASLVADGEAAKAHFVQANLRLVVSIVKRYQHLGIPLLDLVQEGNVGLIRAVERFDPSREVRFSTYATWWIRQAALRSLIDQGRVIRLPARTRARVAEVHRAEAWLEGELGRQPTTAEVAAELGLTPDQVAEARRLALVTRSISEPAGEDGELMELVEDPTATSPADDVVDRAVPAEVHRLLRLLDERERRVVAMRFGLGGTEPRTLDQVGDVLGISRERVRQIERKALRKLQAVASEAEARQLLAG